MKMKSILTGMVLGALAVTAINNRKSDSVMKKGKKFLIKKMEDLFNV